MRNTQVAAQESVQAEALGAAAAADAAELGAGSALGALRLSARDGGDVRTLASMGAALGALQATLEVHACKVVVAGLQCPGKFASVNCVVEAGELAVVTGPRLQLRSNVGPAAVLQALAGAPPKGTSGKAVAVGDGVAFDLLRSRLPKLEHKTTIPRKATPAEVLQHVMIMDGLLSAKSRRKVMKLIPVAFDGLLDCKRVLSTKIQVGDRDVLESQWALGRNMCCQFMKQLTALERRKLEFLCEFVRSRRPNTMLMLETKELVYHELFKFVQFLRAFCTRSGTANVIIRIKALSGRTIHLCDKIVVMSGKDIVFSGRPDNLMAYTQDVLLFKRPESFSVAEFLIDSIDPFLHGADVSDIVKAYEDSAQYLANFDTAQKEILNAEGIALQVHSEKFKHIGRWFAQLRVTFFREHQNYYRTAGLTTLRCLLYCVFAIMVAVISWLTSNVNDTAQRIWMLIALIDFVVAASLFGMFALRLERKTLEHELGTGRVLLSSWLLGHFFGSSLGLLYVALPPAILTYFLLELHIVDDSASSLVLFLANFWVVLIICEALWVLVVLLAPPKKNATILASFLTLAFVLGQSIFTKIADLPANRYVLFISIFKPAMNTFFERTYSGTLQTYNMPLEWSGDDACVIEPNSDSNFTASQVLSCLETRVWSGSCDINLAQGTRWAGNDALECLGFPPGSAASSFVASLAIIILIKL
eukprot:CAMPEP_0184548436 /NCGR_PEP_ID=MMETSP0199_2-20130426/6203_1 /TAXON_ID=1112570 /ORGANISM="Thraustochytrium sp., Strain LLF1b" /LENGTH=702 /DNA_ID=CAMNT_0026943049 /DNA_START=37 /DNA_END=2142 /DNA_ORIENTATION=+